MAQRARHNLTSPSRQPPKPAPAPPHPSKRSQAAETRARSTAFIETNALRRHIHGATTAIGFALQVNSPTHTVIHTKSPASEQPSNVLQIGPEILLLQRRRTVSRSVRLFTHNVEPAARYSDHHLLEYRAAAQSPSPRQPLGPFDHHTPSLFSACGCTSRSPRTGSECSASPPAFLTAFGGGIQTKATDRGTNQPLAATSSAAGETCYAEAPLFAIGSSPRRIDTTDSSTAGHETQPGFKATASQQLLLNRRRHAHPPAPPGSASRLPVFDARRESSGQLRPEVLPRRTCVSAGQPLSQSQRPIEMPTPAPDPPPDLHCVHPTQSRRAAADRC